MTEFAMDLYLFVGDRLYVRRRNGPIHRFNCYSDLNFREDLEEDAHKAAVIAAFGPKLAESGYAQATSAGQLGLYSYEYVGLREVECSERIIFHDRFLTEREIEERTPPSNVQQMAVFRCPCITSDISQEFPREIPGYGPQWHTFWSTTRFVEFWVDPDQKDAAEAALRAKGWKHTSDWKDAYTSDQKSKERTEIRNLLIISNADISSADISSADISSADISSADGHSSAP